MLLLFLVDREYSNMLDSLAFIKAEIQRVQVVSSPLTTSGRGGIASVSLLFNDSFQLYLVAIFDDEISHSLSQPRAGPY